MRLKGDTSECLCQLIEIIARQIIMSNMASQKALNVINNNEPTLEAIPI